MKLKEFLERLPEPFAIQMLEALPAPDRKDLLRRHNAKVKVSAGSLKRATRMAKECGLLMRALLRSDDGDAARTFLQGWLARRAEMIVKLLDAWEIEHQNGIVEDFSWVQKLEAEKVKESLKVLEELEGLEPFAPLVYFAYLEMPCTAEVYDLDEQFKQIEAAAAQPAKR
jgi:hypothetical protein